MSGIRTRVLLVATNLLSIACLIWALRDAHLSELKDDLATMNWWWVALAVAAGLSVYLWQALRWRLVLRPVLRLGFWQTVNAIYVGLFANEVLPFRAGEVLRCYLLAEGTELPFSVSLTSALIERIFDGLWLFVCVFAVLHYIPLPPHMGFLLDGAYVLGAVLLVIALVLSVVMFRRHKVHAAPTDTPFQRQLHVLADDLEIMGHSRYLSMAFLQSLPYLLLQVIPVYASFRGYGFDLSLGTAFALMVILRLGAAVPGAPGNLGLFQFLARESLEKVFNVVPAEAARFSLVLWGIVTLPLLVAGLVALWMRGLKFGEIHQAARSEAGELTRSRS